MYSMIFALALIAVPQAARGFEHHTSCWPSNTTKERCFAALPPGAMPWPKKTEDTYVSNDEEVVDIDDFSVTSVQKNPIEFCRYKDQLVNALGCLSQAMATQCPFLPEEMMMKTERMQMAFDNFCDKKDLIDPGCMTKHWQATMDCHKTLSGDKTRGKRKPSRKRPYQGKKDWNTSICRKKYDMMQCVNKAMEECDSETAAIMNQFMRDMCSVNCSDKMDTWTEEGCTGSYCAAGATGLSVAWATVLSSAFTLLLRYRVWFE